MTKKKIIHFVLSKEDEDIIRWKEALPKYTFNKYVNWILTAESRGKWGIVPYGYSSASIPDVVNGRLTVTNPDALAMIKKMKKMHVSHHPRTPSVQLGTHQKSDNSSIRSSAKHKRCFHKQNG